MSSFLPIDAAPYWTAPRKSHDSPKKSTESPRKSNEGSDAPQDHDKQHHEHGRYLNESLSKLLHAFHLHHYGHSIEKDVEPRVNVVESKANFTAYVELPGMNFDDVHVETNDHLYQVSFSGDLKEFPTVGVANGVAVEHKEAKANEETPESKEPAAGPSGEVPKPAEEKPTESEATKATEGESAEPDLRWSVSERKTGKFHRVLQLPIGFVDIGAAAATMSNGLLVITVPKKAQEVTDKNAAKKVEVAPGSKRDVVSSTQWPLPVGL